MKNKDKAKNLSASEIHAWLKDNRDGVNISNACRKAGVPRATMDRFLAGNTFLGAEQYAGLREVIAAYQLP